MRGIIGLSDGPFAVLVRYGDYARTAIGRDEAQKKKKRGKDVTGQRGLGGKVAKETRWRELDQSYPSNWSLGDWTAQKRN